MTVKEREPLREGFLRDVLSCKRLLRSDREPTYQESSEFSAVKHHSFLGYTMTLH